MHSVKNLWDKLISDENIWDAIMNARKGSKKKRRKKFDKFLRVDKDICIKKVRSWILYYHNQEHEPKVIYDGFTRKKRVILVPTFDELIVQHAIIQVLMPMFQRGMYQHTYASIPGRGAHLGKRYISKYIRKHPKLSNYIYKMDISQFFNSIPHDKLKAKLEKYCKDKRVLKLLFTIIDVCPVGLPLGFYSSQWLANWYLSDFDQEVKHNIGKKPFYRYMDDGAIIAKGKRMLHKMHKNISLYLQKYKSLKLNSRWQIYKFDDRDLNFMGYRFFKNRIILRKSILYKAVHKAKHIYYKRKRRLNVSIYEVRQMLSYLGWIKDTNVYQAYIKRIKPFITFQWCKRRVSSYDRHERLKEMILCRIGENPSPLYVL